MLRNIIHYFLTVLILLFSFSSYGLIFKCENNYSYKIDFTERKLIILFKSNNKNWQKVNNSKVSENSYELLLPDSSYLSCSDKSLNVCEYSTLILHNPKTGQASVREVVLNDCYIGTMGCNKYEKGLELNERRCVVLD